MPNQVKYEVVPLLNNSAFIWRRFRFSSFNVKWHAHPEYEIIYFKKASGKILVGNRLYTLLPGELTMIGPNVPHLFKEESLLELPQGADCYVIHIAKDFLTESGTTFREFIEIKSLFERSESGISFSGKTRTEAARILMQMDKKNDEERVIMLFQLLYILARSVNCEILNTEHASGLDTLHSERGRRVYKYILDHYTDDISLEALAAEVNLTKPALCNYFKLRVKKKYSEFINELRCDLACRLLCETDYGVAQIGFMTGFRNLSYFNRKFLEYSGCTPKNYRKVRIHSIEVIDSQ
jgi:AraC-like DNA-binding protein